ncbi:hypothetical protein AKJ16_DCAP22534 [Drosera capensis]
MSASGLPQWNKHPASGVLDCLPKCFADAFDSFIVLAFLSATVEAQRKGDVSVATKDVQQNRIAADVVGRVNGGKVMPVRSYVSMVNSNPLEKKMKLSFVEPASQGDVPIFVPDEGLLKETHERWNEYLVGYFINGNPRVRSQILEGGPWIFYGKTLILQQWTPNLILCEEQHGKIPLWIKFHKVSLALWTCADLSGIASLARNQLYASSFTKNNSKLAFARICVEIEVGRSFPDRVFAKIEDTHHEIRVEYQDRPVVCKKYRVFGHKCTDTTSANLPLVVEVPKSSNRVIVAATQEIEWMYVQGKNARRMDKGTEINERAKVASSSSTIQTPTDASTGKDVMKVLETQLGLVIEFNCESSDMWIEEHYRMKWQCVEATDLQDLRYRGCRLTWLNRVHGHKTMSRKIDRMQWEMVMDFTSSEADFPTTGVSDHSPMVISIGVKLKKKSRCFKFWIKHPLFMKVVQKA